jgi:uncharacterized repeat protein (TIGR01451 family)
MKRIILSVLLILPALCFVKGQEVTVSASFDTSMIYIGDQIYYTITIEQPSDIALQIIPLKDTLCKNLEIVSGPKLDTAVSGNNRVTINSKYLITSFDTGFYKVPPAFAEINNEGGIRRFYSGYSPLEVVRVKIAPRDTTTKIFDIVKPYRAPLTLGEILPWILLAALAAAVVWGIILLVRKLKKSKKNPEPVINPDPAHIIAFRDLEKLKQDELWQKGEVKMYYSRLTEILRKYLENRYGVYSLEMTTSETLEALVRTGFKKDDSFSCLKTILNGSDLVKFAKYKPESSENEIHFENSWKFVETTRVKEESTVTVDLNKKKEELS